jgi:nucleotide-binding universal stress UspA family protein
MYQRIMVATDGSPLSQKAVDSALELAAAFKAQVTAVSVVQAYSYDYFEGAYPLSKKDVKTVESYWVEKAQKLLDTATFSAAAKGVPIKTQVLTANDVAEALVTAAHTMDADLIVMASHGRRGFDRLLHGSETQEVLNHCKVPVLVLR